MTQVVDESLGLVAGVYGLKFCTTEPDVRLCIVMRCLVSPQKLPLKTYPCVLATSVWAKTFCSSTAKLEQ